MEQSAEQQYDLLHSIIGGIVHEKSNCHFVMWSIAEHFAFSKR